jgi:transcriptional regulator with XRE-family HTH domain
MLDVVGAGVKTSNLKCRDYLAQELLRRKERNPSYSLRSFARDLRLSPSCVSEILNNKRSPSPKNVRKIAEKLALDPALIT